MEDDLRNARIRRGLTLEQAALRVGVRAELLMEWEEGVSEPLGFQLRRIAEAYGCSPDELLGLPEQR